MYQEDYAEVAEIQRILLAELDSYVENRCKAFGVAKATDAAEAEVVVATPEAGKDKGTKGSLRERVGLGPRAEGEASPKGSCKLDDPGGLASKDAEAATPKPGEEEYGDDERTLWVDIDEHGEQWKPWRSAVRESFTRRWGPEFDLDGPPSALEVCKHFDKNGGDPRLWLQLFEADKGIKRTDRLHHEMTTLIDTLYYAGSVDSLNLGGLLCLEVVARRLESIVEALRDGQEHANWDTAKYLAGRRSAMDCVSAGLRSWASTQVQNEVRVHSYRSRARGLASGVAQDDDGEVGATAPGGPTPANANKRPKGKGRGRQGRGAM